MRRNKGQGSKARPSPLVGVGDDPDEADSRRRVPGKAWGLDAFGTRPDRFATNSRAPSRGGISNCTPAHATVLSSGPAMPEIVRKNGSSGCLSRADRHAHIRGGRGPPRRRNSNEILPGLRVAPEKPAQQNFLLAPQSLHRSTSEPSMVKMRELGHAQRELAPLQRELIPEGDNEADRWAQTVLEKRPGSAEKQLSRRAKPCIREPLTPRGDTRSAGSVTRPSPLKVVDALEQTPPRNVQTPPRLEQAQRSPPSPTGLCSPGFKSPASRGPSSGGPGLFRFLGLPCDLKKCGDALAVEGKHVNFCPTPMNTVHPITPYSQIYGKHPHLFDYNRKGEMELNDAGIAAEMAASNKVEACN